MSAKKKHLRRRRRLTCPFLTVQVKLGGLRGIWRGAFTLTAIDFNAYGMGVIGKRPLTIGQEVILSMATTTLEVDHIIGFIVHQCEEEDFFRFGIQFDQTQLNETKRHQLLELEAQIEAHSHQSSKKQCLESTDRDDGQTPLMPPPSSTQIDSSPRAPFSN